MRRPPLRPALGRGPRKRIRPAAALWDRRGADHALTSSRVTRSPSPLHPVTPASLPNPRSSHVLRERKVSAARRRRQAAGVATKERSPGYAMPAPKTLSSLTVTSAPLVPCPTAGRASPPADPPAPILSPGIVAAPAAGPGEPPSGMNACRGGRTPGLSEPMGQSRRRSMPGPTSSLTLCSLLPRA